MTAREAAALLGVTANRVGRLVAGGILNGRRIDAGPGMVYIAVSRASVEAEAERRRAAKPTGKAGRPVKRPGKPAAEEETGHDPRS